MKLRLRELRQKRKLTQNQLAAYIGCTVGSYSKFETGDREPSIQILEKLADYYRVSVDYLIGRDTDAYDGLSDDEKKLVEMFRQTPEFVSKGISTFVEELNSYLNK